MNGGVGSTLELKRVRVACGLFALAFALIAPACTGIEPCKKRGITEACNCDGGGMGTRACLPELVWDHCECGTLPAPDSGVAGMSASGTGGAGAVSGGGVSGSSGSSGSASPAGSGGSSGSGGTSGQSADDDAGMDMMPAGGASGSGGIGGGAGTSGSGGSAGSMATGTPYKACMNASECGMGATCESAVDPDDDTMMVHACAPACSDASTCPKPSGSYTAMVVCMGGHCRIDCSAPLLQADLTCPSGMRCASSDLLGPSFCF